VGLSGNCTAEVPISFFSFFLFFFFFVSFLGVKEMVAKKLNYTRRVPIMHVIRAVWKSVVKLGTR